MKLDTWFGGILYYRWHRKDDHDVTSNSRVKKLVLTIKWGSFYPKDSTIS